MPVISGAPDRSSAAGALSGLVPGQRWRRVLAGEERQLGVLRRWLASLLPDCPARDDTLVVATELASNAIQHTASGGSWFAVEVTWHGPVLQIAVADCGGPGEPQVIDDPAGERGRGLRLVQGLSARTGYVGDDHGRTVWAQIAWTVGPSAAVSAPWQAPVPAVVREAARGRRPAWMALLASA